MPSSSSRRLLSLPNEVLLSIFYQTSSMPDACHLAQSCSQLYQLFKSPRRKMMILRSAAGLCERPALSLRPLCSALKRLPQSNWYLRSSESKSWLLVEVNYGSIPPEQEKYAFHSLSTIPSAPETPTFQAKLHEFLQQFRSFSTRWNVQHEHTTQIILQSAAELQSETLRRFGTDAIVATDLSGENTILALALHCFIVTRDLHLLYGAVPPNMVEYDLFGTRDTATPVQGGLDGEVLLPTFKITKHKRPQTRYIARVDDQNGTRGHTLPPWHLDAGIEDMVSHIAELSFRLLNTQDPRHWPTVFYVLTIIYHVAASLCFTVPFMEKMETVSLSVRRVFRNVSRYFYISTEGGFILDSRWDEDAYADAVGNAELPIKYAAILRDFWTQDDGPERITEWGSGKVYEGIDGFSKKVGFFARALFQ
ncbi:hypothetical protein BJY04DRAFT_216686 [Aspergillus karnatakaensis]|uniref:uncharacterized protein n=1 Tax=Aspergillus karnatakaensis TaxID=1810916 RepID=UPI003CCC9CA5